MAACCPLLLSDEYGRYDLRSFLGSLGASHGYCVFAFFVGFSAYPLTTVPHASLYLERRLSSAAKSVPRSEGLGGQILRTDCRAHHVLHFEPTLSKRSFLCRLKITVLPFLFPPTLPIG